MYLNYFHLHAFELKYYVVLTVPIKLKPCFTRQPVVSCSIHGLCFKGYFLRLSKYVLFIYHRRRVAQIVDKNFKIVGLDFFALILPLHNTVTLKFKKKYLNNNTVTIVIKKNDNSTYSIATLKPNN